MQDQLILRAGESSSHILSEDDDEDEKKYDEEEENMGSVSGRRGNARSYR